MSATHLPNALPGCQGEALAVERQILLYSGAKGAPLAANAQPGSLWAIVRAR